MEAIVKKTRRKLTLEEQKTKLESAKLKMAEQEAKLAVAELKSYIKDVKVANVGSLFNVIKASKPDVKEIDILRTIADIAGLKVTITEKTIATRAKRKKAE